MFLCFFIHTRTFSSCQTTMFISIYTYTNVVEVQSLYHLFLSLLIAYPLCIHDTRTMHSLSYVLHPVLLFTTTCSLSRSSIYFYLRYLSPKLDVRISMDTGCRRMSFVFLFSCSCRRRCPFLLCLVRNWCSAYYLNSCMYGGSYLHQY